jgi:hypothetical protein
MAKLIALSIDVSKLDKSKFVKGKKGTYANITISVNDEEDQFGNNVSAWESQTKEERDEKANRNFLGNGKTVWSSDGAPKSGERAKEEEEDDLPF